MPLPSVSEIESGRSILFLGAGFSAEATNISGEKIKSVDKLIKQLLDACDITDQSEYDLETASEEYTSHFTEQETVALLHNNFRSDLITEDQRIVVCQPWYRIYTTNYDDIVERVCFEQRKSYTTKEIHDRVEPPINGTTQLLHIYGNITRASGEEFRDRFLLTEKQRDNSPFVSSSWFRKFYDDILSAPSVFFVGFSLRDIDIRRLLGKMPSSVLRKIHFVGSMATPKPTKTRLSSFGEFHPIEVSGLAAHLGVLRPGAPLPRSADVPAFLEELTFSFAESKTISASDIHYLLSVGVLDKKLFAQSDVSGKAGSYSISRSAQQYVRATHALGGGRPVVIHSDIGNGKSVFAMQCAYILAGSNYRVFIVERESERDGDIISFLQSVPGNVAVIFDDILRFRSLIKRIAGIGRSDLRILVTARSAIIESSKGALEQRIGNVSYVEIDLNFSPPDEIRNIGAYLRENGLLGIYADFNDSDLNRFLEQNCGGQLRDIVLTLFETGVLHERVKSVLSNIKLLDAPAQRLTIFGALITFAGLQEFGSLNFVSELVGYDGLYEELRSSYVTHDLYGLIRIDRAEIAFRSPALAEFVLRNVTDTKTLLEIVKSALFFINRNYYDDPDFEPLSRSLLRYSHYGKLVKESKDSDDIEAFYDACRVLGVAQKEPLFWIQRSICNMNAGYFQTAKKYVETAYALAGKLFNFDTYQIDNHYAKLILTRALKDGVSDEALEETAAQDLLDAVIARKHDDLYHPLSVMRLYIDIVQRWGNEFDDIQRRNMKSNINKAIKSMTAFSFKAKRRFRNIEGITKKLQQANLRLG